MLGVLPPPSSQEILAGPEDHTWVCDCTKEGSLLCGTSSLHKKRSPQRISCIHREGLMRHVRGACAQQLRMFARGVSPSSPTALQRYGTHRNDWEMEHAVQKVRGFNMKQSLRRLWYGRCVNTKLSLCLIFRSTPEVTLIVATRGAISSNLQQNWVPDRNVPFLLCCVATDTIVPLNSTQEDRGQKRQRKGSGKGQKVHHKEEAVAQLATALAKQVLKNALGIREMLTCATRVFILPKDSDMAASIKSAYEEFGACFSNVSKEEQQNIVSPSVAAWIGLVRTTMSAPTLPRQHQQERAHGGSEAGQNAQGLG